MKKKQQWVKNAGVILTVSGLLTIAWGMSPNRSISVSSYDIINSKLDPVFDGYKIVQVSDLHNASFGSSQEKLIELIKAQDPDLIVLTGDMVGNCVPDYDKALILITEAIKIAPVIVVDGNHDAQIESYPIQKQAMIDAGAIVLADQSMSISIGNQSFNLIGMKERFEIEDRGVYINDLIDPARFNLLLAHHPENFTDYARTKADLVLTGHAHGGQFRFFGVPIYSPDQGLFPKYTAGPFSQESTTMIVSRGLGESVLPLRLFNPPEMCVITLNHQ
jgi:predicted MPP superfamily phosphohydrolase